MKFIISIFFYAILIVCLSACKKNNQAIIPYVQVDQSLYLVDPINFNLNFVGGWRYLNGGSRGIVVYRLSQDQFVAFDRHCTYDINNPCGMVSIDTNSFFLTDTCCGSSFLVSDGAVYHAPAQFPLQAYRTSFIDNTVRIYN